MSLPSFLRRHRYYLLASVALAALAFQTAPLKYQTYHNARFGYSIPYPAALVKPFPESRNGDGRRFVSADAATTLTAYAHYNALDYTVAQQLQMSRKSWQRRGATITLAQTLPGSYVLSGTYESAIFYEKGALQNGTFSTFIWQYPAAQKQRMDAVVTYTARAFRPGQ
ncbi:hypothetical protein EJV47_08140 [Hymenobacter gummosus]|uniref:Uncharacterized protein n=1 Tax=Hymenobacter gummosus TaxID=1776032 RepID=A0A431U4R2_9BACT|nr:hypothetical protein [Hymenobacter gummosus]RTQ50598.1 hypothetical protein EJV47_08140 [Hymenobacter gummosus]